MLPNPFSSKDLILLTNKTLWPLNPFTRFAADSSSSDEGGGGGEGGGEGGSDSGTPSPPKSDTKPGGESPPKTPAPQMFDVPSGDGKILKVNQEELIKLAAKAAGADQRFEEAAKVRKEAKKGLRIQELTAKIGTEDMTDTEANELMSLLNISSDQLTGPSQTPSKGKPQPRPKVTMEDLDEKTRNLLKLTEASELEKTQEKIAQKVRNAIDTDPHLSKIISAVSDKQKDGFCKTLYDMAIDDTLDQIYQGQELGPELLQRSVQRMRKRLENLGIPTERPDTLPITMAVEGLDHLAQEISSQEPIKREDTGSETYEENAIKRFARQLFQARRAGNPSSRYTQGASLEP